MTVTNLQLPLPLHRGCTTAASASGDEAAEGGFDGGGEKTALAYGRLDCDHGAAEKSE